MRLREEAVPDLAQEGAGTVDSFDHVGSVRLCFWHRVIFIEVAMRATKILCCLILSTAALFAQEPSQFTVGAFAFTRPGEWKWIVPSSPMRKAQLSVPGEAGSAEITFFHFGPGQGGSTDANIQRWLNQFSSPADAAKPTPEVVEIDGRKITFIRTTGTFASGMPGGPATPLDGYALRGAILNDPASGDVYVKMTGPAKTVEAAEGAFDAMVKSAKRP